MKKNLAFSLILLATVLSSACEGNKPTKVNAMQNRDKQLSCDDISLEINESEFYRKEAEKSRGLGVKTVLMPLGYIDTYMNADEAITAADARINYLNRVYEIRKCDQQIGMQQPQQQMAQPQVQYYQMPPMQQYGSPNVVQRAPGY